MNVRRLQITGAQAIELPDDKAVSAHLAPMQPKFGERNARTKRVHLLNWFWNQGERSRLLVRNGFIIGRIDCVLAESEAER